MLYNKGVSLGERSEVNVNKNKFIKIFSRGAYFLNLIWPEHLKCFGNVVLTFTRKP